MSAPVVPSAAAEVEPVGRVSVWRRLILAPIEWLRVLLFPFDGLPRVLSGGRFGGALFLVTVCAGLLVAASATRLDMMPVQLRQELHPGGPGGGRGAAADGQGMSDREFDEAVTKAYTVEVVKMSGRALLVPLRLLLLGVFLYLVGRFVGGKPTMRAAAALAVHAGLPGAVKALIGAAAALRQSHLTPDMIPRLVASPWGSLDGPPLARLLAGLSPFALWTGLLLALGFPYVANVGRAKAYVTVGICFVLYQLVSL